MTVIGSNIANAKNAAEKSRVFEEWKQKFDLLFDEFGLDRGDYPMLALHLALKYHPGFRLVSADAKRGRPQNDPLDLIRLLADVEVIKRRKRWVKSSDSDAAAISEIRTQSTFAKRWGRYTQRSLQNLLTAARDANKNPWLRFWDGPARKTARNGLINLFSITEKGN